MSTIDPEIAIGAASRRARSDPARRVFRARMLLTLLVALTTLAAVLLWQSMQHSTPLAGPTVVSLLTTTLLAINITWLGLFFWTAVFGWVAGRFAPDAHEFGAAGSPVSDCDGRPSGVAGSTVIVIPIYHEDCDAIAERMSWMQDDLEAAGAGRHFSWYLLSDSNDPDCIKNEEGMLARLREGAFREVSLDYRRRSDRSGHKAGNLREFVERHASRWSNMVVLDADSLMSARRLLALESDLERRPDTAIIQTPPTFHAAETRWARLLAQPAATFGPMLARGAAIWQGAESNYWGHNAIVRIAPFREHAILPTLSGNGPLSGAIRSHDFVEAALLLRAGWATRLDPRSGGSWELVPPDPLRFLQRDRRWMHGNLQHLRLLPGRGWNPMSRLHFLVGAMGYLIAPIWLAFILLTVGSQSLQPGSAAGGALVSVAGLALLSMLVMLLIGPRLLSLLDRACGDAPGFEAKPGPKRSDAAFIRGDVPGLQPHGSRFAARVGVLARELFWMALVAPVFMLWHSVHMLRIGLRGRAASGWGAQQRSSNAEAFCENARAQRGIAVLGGVLLLLVLVTPMSPWVVPLAVSALLAPAVMGWLAVVRREPRAQRVGKYGSADVTIDGQRYHQRRVSRSISSDDPDEPYFHISGIALEPAKPGDERQEKLRRKPALLRCLTSTQGMRD